MSEKPEWLDHPHPHDPNPTPPTDDPTLRLVTPSGLARISVEDLRRLPVLTLPDSYIVSTGHPRSGPFTFTGVLLGTVIGALAPGDWSAALIISDDGFGTRVTADEWAARAQPVLLAHTRDGQPLTREEGLVRLIVPSETDEALRQIKWVGEIRLIE